MARVSKFFCHALVLVALVARGAVAMDEGVLLSETFGGPHGTKYSDIDAVSAGQTLQSVTVQAGERVNGVGVSFTDPAGAKTDLYHGGRGGNPNTLSLGPGEHITGIEAHWGEKDDHTRIKFLRLTTSTGTSIQGGNPTKDVGKGTAPEGFQLGGFFGTSGGELDSVGAVWTSIAPVRALRG